MTSQSTGSAEIGDLPQQSGPSRRRLLTMAGGSAAAVGLALGPFAHLFTAGAAPGGESPEITLATQLVGLELAASGLYDQVHASSGVPGPVVDLASACSTHHQAQSKALGAMITAAGGTVPTEPNAAFTAQWGPRVGQAADAPSLGTVFTQMEDGFAATYLAALSTVTSAPLAGVCAQILATDAGQAVAWSAVANGQGAKVPLPAQDQVPTFQTTSGQFTESDYATTTTEAQS